MLDCVYEVPPRHGYRFRTRVRLGEVVEALSPMAVLKGRHMKHESHDWQSLEWDEATGEYMCSRCLVCTCCCGEKILECPGEVPNDVIH